MRDYEFETQKRIEFIRSVVKSSGADGIVYGNSGGKDCTLVGILCKKACDNTLGLIMPCGSNQNYTTDKTDAQAVAKQFDIETRTVDLSDVKNEFVRIAGKAVQLDNSALVNIAPRLRMTTLYAAAAGENRIVAGTGNRSEIYMGYFTKWGDGACDFNPIADLSVSEIYEFLRFLKAPACVIEKAPSAGLFDGQTDEKEMGITYRGIDEFLLNGEASEDDKAVIKRFHDRSEHKRTAPILFES
ncbi:MAG: NAD(+) synthase [Chitinispirillales bacterium]|jgi:NAD+ synthase|nr:NAD(+) synthase [Chitinispirillales bacterium]